MRFRLFEKKCFDLQLCFLNSLLSWPCMEQAILPGRSSRLKLEMSEDSPTRERWWPLQVSMHRRISPIYSIQKPGMFPNEAPHICERYCLLKCDPPALQHQRSGLSVHGQETKRRKTLLCVHGSRSCKVPADLLCQGQGNSACSGNGGSFCRITILFT